MRLRYLFVGALLLLAVVVVAIWMRSPAEHVGGADRAGLPPAPRQLVTGGEARDAEGTAISGRVTDASTATPIERARVCAVASTRRLGRFSFSTRCVRTDHAGAYELNASAPLRIDVEAQGFLPASRALVAGQRVMDFALEPAGVLVSGVVGDALGGVIEGANVVAWSDTVHIGATSDEDGVFSLWMSEMESYRVLAQADGYAANSTVVLPFRMRHVEILLSPGLVLRGRVVDAKSGRGVPDVRVHANAPRMGMLRWQPRTTPTATTDGEGRFVIDRLPPGV